MAGSVGVRVLAVAAACLAAALMWIVAGRPQPLTNGLALPFDSVSFSPYRRGQDPFSRRYPSIAEIDRDLALLRPLAKGVRVYTAREGLEAVPELAVRHGLSVVQGAWLVNDEGHNADEVSALIALANAHPKSLRRLVVGNEVLMRGELTPAQLAAHIRRAKAAVAQPVSYADGRDVWFAHPEIGAEVDVITVHLIPYWEPLPVPPESAEAYVLDTVGRLRALFPGKPVVVGEAGWPTAGRSRGGAVADPAGQAEFLRTVVRLGREHGFEVNIVEAFDQPWKRHLEGTVGGAWGVFDVDRQRKPALTNALPGLEPARAATATAAAAMAVLAAFGALTAMSMGAVLAVALLAQAMFALAVSVAFAALPVEPTPLDTAVATLRGTFALAFAATAVMAVAQRMARHRSRGWMAAAHWLALPGTALAAVWSLLLAFDGRTRDIPLGDLAVLACGLAAIVAADRWRDWRDGTRQQAAGDARGHALAAVVLLVAGLAALAGEGLAVLTPPVLAEHPGAARRLGLVLGTALSNTRMLGWSGLLAGMAWLHLARARRLSRAAD